MRVHGLKTRPGPNGKGGLQPRPAERDEADLPVVKNGRPELKTTARTLRDCLRAPAHACEVHSQGRGPERDRPRFCSGDIE
jgi:hypothetical protein